MKEGREGVYEEGERSPTLWEQFIEEEGVQKTPTSEGEKGQSEHPASV